jgi:CheY-like chemotaxis protein
MNPGQTKLLVVEDNPADRALYRIYLQYVPGLAIAEAEFGGAALDLCHSIAPDCILLDFTLPDMNGLQFMERLRTQNGGIPCAVVMLTGIADERVAIRAVNAGATDYMPKSENMEAVLEHSIFNAIDKHRLEKELEKNRLELARSEHLHRSLMKALPQLVWTARAPASSEPGTLTFGNRQWWDYVGNPEQERERFD